MQAQKALESLKWPLRVLELLIYNTEQVSTVLLVNASLVTLLARSLQVIDLERMPPEIGQVSIVSDVVKVLAALLMRP